MAYMDKAKRDDWGTPPGILKWVGVDHGKWIDVAASKENRVVQRYIDKDRDALRSFWGETGTKVWCNPPYGRELMRWVDKAVIEVAKQGGPDCVWMLLPARTDTRWFRLLTQYAGTIYFITGRLKFVGAPAAAPFPSMLARLDNSSYNNFYSSQTLTIEFSPEQRGFTPVV